MCVFYLHPIPVRRVCKTYTLFPCRVFAGSRGSTVRQSSHDFVLYFLCPYKVPSGSELPTCDMAYHRAYINVAMTPWIMPFHSASRFLPGWKAFTPAPHRGSRGIQFVFIVTGPVTCQYACAVYASYVLHYFLTWDWFIIKCYNGNVCVTAHLPSERG